MTSANEEEQLLEIEALKSIYFEEYEEDSTSPTKFGLRLAADESLRTDPDTVDVSTCRAKVVVEFTPQYPSEVPQLELMDTEGLDEDEEQALRRAMETAATENLGVPMIYTLAALAKEWLDKTFSEKLTAYRTELDRKAIEEEELENAKFVGTPVTREAFLAWKKTFDAEMAVKKAKEREKLQQEGKKRKLNGRQLFETDSSLVASDQLDEGDEVVEVDALTMQGLAMMADEEENADDDQDRSFLYED